MHAPVSGSMRALQLPSVRTPMPLKHPNLRLKIILRDHIPIVLDVIHIFCSQQVHCSSHLCVTTRRRDFASSCYRECLLLQVLAIRPHMLVMRVMAHALALARGPWQHTSKLGEH